MRQRALVENAMAFFPFWTLPSPTPQIPLPVLATRLLGANPGVVCRRRNLPPPIVLKLSPRAACDLVARPSLPQTLRDVPPHFPPLHFGNPGSLASTPLGFLPRSHRPGAVAPAVAIRLWQRVYTGCEELTLADGKIISVLDRGVTALRSYDFFAALRPTRR